ncbi:MAG TPA: hypothetical protein VJ654_03325 [Noviherbaspirillum sp.]|nr:hypothetical protein [Noviherbaspirillum sp.]
MKPTASFPGQALPLAPVVSPTTGANRYGPVTTSRDKNEKGAAADKRVQIVGLPIFNSLAGVSEEPFASTHEDNGGGSVKQAGPKPLFHRVKTAMHRPKAGKKRMEKTNTAVVRGDADDEEEDLHGATSSALTIWRQNGWHSFQSLLSTKYEDPLERYALLHNALTEIDKESKERKARNEPEPPEADDQRRTLQSMKSELLNKHGDVLRNGLAGKDAMQSLMTSLGANSGIAPASLPELRYLYGAKGSGKFDAPLTPYAMAKILQQKFGNENFSAALGELRAKMATDLLPNLNRRQRRDQPPYLWLTLADAAAFNAVQSSYGIACDLRRDLVDKANALPKTDHTSIAVMFLGIAEGGKGKGDILVNQIADVRNMNNLQKAKVTGIIQTSVKRLPTTMWPADKLSQRQGLLDELSEMVVEGHKGTMPWLEKAQRREKEWHKELTAQGSSAKGKSDAPSAYEKTQGEAPPAYVDDRSKENPHHVQREKLRGSTGTGAVSMPPPNTISVET